MSECFVLDIEYLQYEVVPISLVDLEDVPSYKFVDQVLPKFGSDLECIDPQAEQNLDHSFNVLLVEILFELLLVLDDDRLAEQLGALQFSFVDDDLVMLS